MSGDNDNSLFLITPNRAGCDNLNALAVICREYPYHYHLTPFFKVNRNYSIGIIKEKFIYLVLTNGDIDLFFKQIEEKLKKNLIPIKPNRTFERKKNSRHKYPIAQKKAI